MKKSITFLENLIYTQIDNHVNNELEFDCDGTKVFELDILHNNNTIFKVKVEVEITYFEEPFSGSLHECPHHGSFDYDSNFNYKILEAYGLASNLENIKQKLNNCDKF